MAGLFSACRPPTQRAVQGARKDILHAVGPCGFSQNSDVKGGRPPAKELTRSSSTGDWRASPLVGLITLKNLHNQ